MICLIYFFFELNWTTWLRGSSLPNDSMRWVEAGLYEWERESPPIGWLGRKDSSEKRQLSPPPTATSAPPAAMSHPVLFDNWQIYFRLTQLALVYSSRR